LVFTASLLEDLSSAGRELLALATAKWSLESQWAACGGGKGQILPRAARTRLGLLHRVVAALQLERMRAIHEKLVRDFYKEVRRLSSVQGLAALLASLGRDARRGGGPSVDQLLLAACNFADAVAAGDSLAQEEKLAKALRELKNASDCSAEVRELCV